MDNFNTAVNSEHDILTGFETIEKGLISPRTIRILVLSIVAIAIADIGVTLYTIPYFEEPYFPNTTTAALFFFLLYFIVAPVASFLIALLLSLCIFKKRKYAEKYPAMTVVILLIVQVAFLTLSTIDFIKNVLK